MSDTEKEGKCNRRPKIRTRSKRASKAISGTRWGGTEKIQRRNRKLWSRLFAKANRATDKETVQDGLEPTES